METKTYLFHRFTEVWDCYKRYIPDGTMIGHINDVKDDNQFCNLQFLTKQQKNKKYLTKTTKQLLHLLKII